MGRKEMIAMLLAGGEGKRLGILTKDLAKPAVHFGGKYRMIDFALSNCSHSGIDTVGVLTQYQPLVLNRYLGVGAPWGLDRQSGGMTVLPPYMRSKGGAWYNGTANAIYQNIGYIERYDPEYVLVVSGDHIYKMDYARMLDHHKRERADATIAVIEVDPSEANRFGIVSADDGGRIVRFEEKPERPASNLASMGVYIFTWSVLRQYLIRDAQHPGSSNDFGKDVIPAMLRGGAVLSAYGFDGYWKDVGTIRSLWEANMDLLGREPRLRLNDMRWRIFSVNPNQPAHYVSPTGSVDGSLVAEGCYVEGAVENAVLFYGVHVGERSVIRDSVVMPKARIGRDVSVHRAIIGEGAVLGDGAIVGEPDAADIAVVGSGAMRLAEESAKEVQA